MTTAPTTTPVLRKLQIIEEVIDSFTRRTGRLVAWLSLLMMGLTFLVVLLRYLFNIGSIALQETTLYLHAIVFLFCAAYTLQANRHVRVDILYRKFSPRTQALVNLIGCIGLLLPTLAFVAWSSWDYIAIAWHIGERSGDAGGLPFTYLLKSAILGWVILLGLQGVAEAIRALRQWVAHQ